MAGGNPPKSSLQKPSPSSASSSHRKSRWESSNNNNNNNNNKKSPAEPKSGDAKPPKPSTNPSPKTKPTPSPAQTKPPADPTPHAGYAGIASPGAPFPFPDGPPPPPAYGFHMLERRTIVLADGSVRSYFALPPDYQDFTPPPRPLDPSGRLLPIGPGIDPAVFDKRFLPGGPMSPGRFPLDDQFGQGRHQDYWNSLGLNGRGAGEGSAKRKYGDEDNKDRKDERDELARQRQQLLHNANSNAFPRGPGGERGDFSMGTSGALKRDLMDAGRDAEFRASKYMRVAGSFENVGFRQVGGVGDNLIHKHLEVDQDALKKAFLHFVKAINENVTQKKKYLEDGKQGRLQCVACGRFDGIGLDMFVYFSFAWMLFIAIRSFFLLFACCKEILVTIVIVRPQ